jgi:hypothetical protein
MNFGAFRVADDDERGEGFRMPSLALTKEAHFRPCTDRPEVKVNAH